MVRLQGILKTLKSTYSLKGSNWKAILLAILVASVFWLFQSLNKNYSTSLKYPIEFHFPTEQYVVMEKLPEEILIHISGVGWNIFRKTFSFGVTPILINLESPESTRKIVAAGLLANINDQLPQFHVNYVISDTLHFNIEPKVSRTFGVYFDSLSLDLKDNFQITSPITLGLNSVTIAGPQFIIKQLPTSLPLVIDEKKIDKTVDDDVLFTIHGYNQSLFEVFPKTIGVYFEVKEFVTVSYKAKLTAIENSPTNIYALDSMVNVIYTVPKSAEETIDKLAIEIVALPKTLNKKDSTLQLFIRSYPEEITSIRLDSTSINLKVIYD